MSADTPNAMLRQPSDEPKVPPKDPDPIDPVRLPPPGPKPDPREPDPDVVPKIDPDPIDLGDLVPTRARA